MTRLSETDSAVLQGDRPLSTSHPVPEGTLPEFDSAAGASHLQLSDRRRLLQAEAHRAAKTLAAAPSLAKRIDIYNRSGRHLINVAASLFPELMPTLNGEFEFIELTRADHD